MKERIYNVNNFFNFMFMVLLMLFATSITHASNLLFIYSSSTAGDSIKAVNYKTLFDSFGHTTTLIKINDILTTQLSNFDLIIVSGGTYSSSGPYDWQGDTTSISAIKNSGKAIIGISRGGGNLFAQLKLWSNSGDAAGNSGYQIKLLSGGSALLKAPNSIPIPSDSILSIYQGSYVNELYIGYGFPTDVKDFALVANDLQYIPFSFEKNRYFYWGFEADPANLTKTGSNLLQNILLYILRATGVVGVQENNVQNDLPNDFILEQNYPNPFNPSTAIKYSVPALEANHTSEVLLEVYDVLGSKVATLVDALEPPGNYVTSFNAYHLASGEYFYKLTSGSFTETKKMLLLK